MRKDVIKNFRMQTDGVIRYQGANGLWRQLLDKPDSYEEITGTAMFVFGIAKGVKEGWLHPDYIYVAWEGLKGMLTKITPEGDVTCYLLPVLELCLLYHFIIIALNGKRPYG